MGEFIVAHKLALLLIGAALGAFVLYTRKGNAASYPNGVPVNPYNANSPSDGGGSFDLSSLLPSGPAGPALDPSASPSNPDKGAAGQAPAAVDNAVAQQSGSTIYAQAIAPYGTLNPDYSFTPSGGTAGPPPNPDTSGMSEADAIAAQQAANAARVAYNYNVANPPDAVARYVQNTQGVPAYVQPLSVSSATGTAPAVSLPQVNASPTDQPAPLPRPVAGQAVAV